MGNTIGSIVIIIAMLFGYISGPIYNSFYEQDTYINNYVKNITNDFQKTVRHTGYIDGDTYNSYLLKLNQTNKMYDVKITYTQNLVYPVKGSDGTTIIGSRIYKIEQGNTIIFDAMYNKKKPFNMKYGDDFHITVTERYVQNSKLMASCLYIFSPASNTKLSFSNGGMIENGS